MKKVGDLDNGDVLVRMDRDDWDILVGAGSGFAVNEVRNFSEAISLLGHISMIPDRLREWADQLDGMAGQEET